MKRFILKAHCSFDAENIDDAFLKLSEHFRRLAQDDNYDKFFFLSGEVHLVPLNKKEIEEG